MRDWSLGLVPIVFLKVGPMGEVASHQVKFAEQFMVDLQVGDFLAPAGLREFLAGRRCGSG